MISFRGRLGYHGRARGRHKRKAQKNRRCGLTQERLQAAATWRKRTHSKTSGSDNQSAIGPMVSGASPLTGSKFSKHVV